VRFYRIERRVILGSDVNCPTPTLCNAQPCSICVKYENVTVNSFPNDHYTDLTPATCEELELRRLKAEIGRRYLEARENLMKRLRDTYTRKCLDITTFADNTTVEYNESYYHYTLAYYDRAGRLSKTVPPRGVDMDPTRTRSTIPSHTMATEFTYNSLGQLITKKGPDVGKTTNYYDALGRLRFSVDEVQRTASSKRASYVCYDKLSRVVETGEVDIQGNQSDLDLAIASNIDNQLYPADPATAPLRKDVKRFHYSSPASASSTSGWTAVAAEYSGIEQKFLRGRLSWTESIPDASSANASKDVVRTYYSYDEHGRAAWSIHDIPYDNTSTSDRLIKRTEFAYDHTLGQTRTVDYQRGKSDRFVHQYDFDGAGRLAEVSTSRDSVIWDRDARYTYFEHGPIKRALLGEDEVQGVDYTYTLLGQLRAINTPDRLPANDPGKDGGSVARDVSDAFGLALSYYAGDYNRTLNGLPSPLNSSTTSILAPAVNTYSGLIGASTWSTQQHSNAGADIVREGQTIGETYRYDVLGRLRGVTTNKWDAGAFTAEPTGGWSSAYKYDHNGNIVRLNRHAKSDDATSAVIDDATLQLVVNGNGISSVIDPYNDPDLKSNEVQAIVTGRLKYDEEGRTTDLSASITEATNQFSSEDLPSSIIRGDASIRLVYDASGLVVRQDVNTETVTDRFYLIPNDATTDLAVYKNSESGSPTIEEWSIVGLGRIGVDRSCDVVVVNDINRRPLGNTYYELTDQAGSVRAVVSDVVDTDPQSQERYFAQVKFASDYEAYGTRRHMRFADLTEAYRYGWQSMRLLDGVDTRIDYITANRLYDVRVGRWLTPDPVFKPGESPYVGMGDNPLSFSDVLGLSPEDEGHGTSSPPRSSQTGSTQSSSTNESNDNFREASEIAYHGWPIPINSLYADNLITGFNDLGVKYEGNTFERNGLLFAANIDKGGKGVFYTVAPASTVYENPQTPLVLLISPERAKACHQNPEDAMRMSNFFYMCTANGDFHHSVYEMAGDYSHLAPGLASDWKGALVDPGFYLMLGASVAALPPALKTAKSPSISGAKTIRPPASPRRLGIALEKEGFVRPPDSHAHHIVAGKAPGAARAREVLANFGIELDEAANGVFLPDKFHRGLHTKMYYKTVNEALRTATNREQAIQILSDIRQSLLKGELP